MKKEIPDNIKERKKVIPENLVKESNPDWKRKTFLIILRNNEILNKI